MKKFLLIVLSLILALTALGAVGCGTDKKEEKSNPLIVLNDFENTKDYDTIHLRGYLGRVTKNTDPTYVTRGEASAKVEVEALRYTSTTKPQSIYQECNLKVKGYNYTDFSYVSDVTVDVYNTQTSSKEFKLQLVYELTNGDELVSEIAEVYSLPAQQWSTIRYTVDRAYIPVVNNVSYVKALVFIFEDPPDSQPEPFDVYYMDNVCLYKTTIPFTNETRSLTHHDNVKELCSFDSLWQIKNLTVSSEDCVSVAWCKDFSSDGVGASLRVDTVPNISGYSNWPCVNISYTMFSSESVNNWVDLTTVDDNDELVFDYYIPGEGMDNVSVTLNAMYDRLFSKTAYGPRGQWNTFRVTIGEINDHIEASENKSNLFYRLKTISFGIGRGLPGSVRSFYIDNVRLVINP